MRRETKRIALGMFGLDVAEMIVSRFNEEKKKQKKGRQRIGGHEGVCIIKRARGHRKVNGSKVGYNDGMELKYAQRIKLYIDIPMPAPVVNTAPGKQICEYCHGELYRRDAPYEEKVYCKKCGISMCTGCEYVGGICEDCEKGRNQ